MNPNDLILKYYGPDTSGFNAYEILLKHSELVAKKAVDIARSLKLDDSSIAIVYESAMLHDIGIFLTDTPELACHGDAPYIMHGVLGRNLLEAEGLINHARICETHVGAGLTAQEIMESELPLPARDMLPASIEEKIVSVADKFYRKNKKGEHQELSLSETIASVARYGPGPGSRFALWLKDLKIKD